MSVWLNCLQWKTCFYLQTIFAVEDRELAESFVLCCNNNHLKLNISQTDELVLNRSASDVSAAAKKLKNLKSGCFTHISNEQLRRSIQSVKFQGDHLRLLSPFRRLTKREIRSQSPRVLLSYGMKSVFGEHYDVTVTMPLLYTYIPLNTCMICHHNSHRETEVTKF